MSGRESRSIAWRSERAVSEAEDERRRDAIRLATQDDVAQIVRLVRAAYAKYLDRMEKPPAPMLTDYAGPDCQWWSICADIERGDRWCTGH